MNKYVSYEDSALLVVFIISYGLSMYIQVHDPDIKISRNDYIIGFLASVIGGYISYAFFSYKSDNPGEILFFTILASVISPRAFKFIVNGKTQERILRSVFDSIFKNKKDGDNHRDI